MRLFPRELLQLYRWVSIRVVNRNSFLGLRVVLVLPDSLMRCLSSRFPSDCVFICHVVLSCSHANLNIVLGSCFFRLCLLQTSVSGVRCVVLLAWQNVWLISAWIFDRVCIQVDVHELGLLFQFRILHRLKTLRMPRLAPVEGCVGCNLFGLHRYQTFLALSPVNIPLRAHLRQGLLGHFLIARSPRVVRLAHEISLWLDLSLTDSRRLQRLPRVNSCSPLFRYFHQGHFPAKKKPLY